jgi:transposase
MKAAGSLEKIAGMSASELAKKTQIGVESARKVVQAVKKGIAAKEQSKQILQSEKGRIAVRDKEKEKTAEELAEAAGA